MGFSPFSTPYDWSRLAAAKKTAAAHPDGMIDLSIGSPVDAVPASVRKALADAANASNAYGYPVTRGTAALRESIARWFRDLRGVDLERIGAGICPTVGSKEGVSLMASLLGLGAGDVVVQPRISYPTYEIGTQLAGATTLKTDVADVESWANVKGVKMVWVNSPSNPSGEVLSAAQLHDIVVAARRIGAVVVSDECYALMDWGSSPAELSATSCILNDDVCDGGAEGLLCLYSLSKQSNMAGYRTALIVGDDAIVAPMLETRKQIGQIIPGPSQAAMAAGLDDVASVIEQRERYRNRLEKLVRGLNAAGYDAAMPQGALYVWVKAISGDCWKDIDDLAGIGIIVSPGEFYGDASYLRVSSTATDAAVDAAVERLTNRR
ncbi:succinyldiaminopimelate transaminase [Bifidobacterium sp. SMB2]|uniref:Succinyldiaminopimelate transaminase n=1 Tax=Bifidobacterium saimiriisciurei TaxID=2661627 RepID=A0ABX0C722_9BIFI|nr:succinyldiaminopimelate transaminase [Bifidobacterium saimiriisciurei]NEG96404.1 succinyldiaminopimelate transaminase [Bifidobacterium sp. SMB2]NEH10964.1 succinyldiaminopimelate transaminase [Bifidobacterium saimiriisciurei]